MDFSLVVRKNKRVGSWSVILDMDGRDEPVHGIGTIILTTDTEEQNMCHVMYVSYLYSVLYGYMGD